MTDPTNVYQTELQNDNMELYVTFNARDREVLLGSCPRDVEGISLFTPQVCREVAAELITAARWLESLPAVPPDGHPEHGDQREEILAGD